jgi:hypothetical protein
MLITVMRISDQESRLRALVASLLVMPTLRYFTIETLRFYAFVNKKNLTNVYFSL